MRLDVFVKLQLRNTSRTRARAIIENSAFSPDGRSLRHNDRVQAEQHVVLWRPAIEEDETELTLREVVQDAMGDWVERSASLQLQEKSK